MRFQLVQSSMLYVRNGQAFKSMDVGQERVLVDRGPAQRPVSRHEVTFTA